MGANRRATIALTAVWLPALAGPSAGAGVTHTLDAASGQATLGNVNRESPHHLHPTTLSGGTLDASRRRALARPEEGEGRGRPCAREVLRVRFRPDLPRATSCHLLQVGK